MSARNFSTARGDEIIAPIRVRAAAAGVRTAATRPPCRWKTAAALLLMVTLTAGGIWWIDHLARHPIEAPFAALPAESIPQLSAPPPSAQDSTEPLQPAAPLLPTEAVSPLLPTSQAQPNAVEESQRPAASSDEQESLRRDPQPQPAKDGAQRSTPRMDEEFRRVMSEGFAALTAGDHLRAQTRFLEAKALRPEAPGVAEALSQAESRLRTARIDAARQRAMAAEQREDWSGALAAYEEALSLEPALQFAQQGKERTAALVDLERRIAAFLSRPGLLDSDSQLEKAERLLQEVPAAAPLGARLNAEADKLGGLVQTAKTPVRVMITSDALTEVSVYRVGRLGRFVERELTLRPGRYTVVGSRDGYRDERRELVVTPGPDPIRVTILCKVKV